MATTLRKLLDKAAGRTEHIIAVFCDIRGFTEFSSGRGRESTDAAMLIKRFYIKLIDDYFREAAFIKPTGDGLLVVFPYNENTLADVSKYVLNAVFRCLADYPKKFFEDDQMITFTPPQKLGFGIARGSASCLYSGRIRIDYSGHLLNLAARLNDYARPQGIVVAGNYMLNTIPTELRSKFAAKEVYVRSIAEVDPPIGVLFTHEITSIPEFALHPIVQDKWVRDERKFTVQHLKDSAHNKIVVLLKRKPSNPSAIRVKFCCPNEKAPSSTLAYDYDYQYDVNAKGPYIRMDATSALALCTKHKAADDTTVSFTADYLPSPER